MIRGAVVVGALLLLAGCEGPQSILNPRGPAAAEVAALWWWMLAVTGIPALLTIAFAVAAALRRRAQALAAPDHSEHPREGRIILVLGGIVTPVILVAILVPSLLVGRSIHTMPDPVGLTIEVVGHQYWWEVRYPELGIVDANEIHLPAGEPVAVRVRTADVIHSFWVPNLQGKLDMMPGRTLDLWLQADEPGVFRGQCAEFCGLQHALMAFEVVAHPREEFDRWAEHARRRGAHLADDDPLADRGREVYLEARCDQCHGVQGLTRESPVVGTGPDLTLVAARRTLGAGTLPNNRGTLQGWILDPQPHKPGVRMPATRIPARDMDALLAFFESMR